MGQVDVATITGILPKLIETGSEVRPLAESRFLKVINKVKSTNMINPGGLFTPYVVSENYGGFAVPEGGAIRGGSKPGYTLAQAQIRQLWKSMSWTGALARIRDQYMSRLEQDPKYSSMPKANLMQLATNRAVADQVLSTFKEYARLENFFALQGGANSAIGVVTAVNAGADTVTFDGLTTTMGNRLFNLGMEIEFRSNAGALRDGTSEFFTVDVQPTHDATGEVHFDNVGGDIIVGDTAHLVNGYGAMPTGVPEYVDDDGNFKGIDRSDWPELFESVMIRHNTNPTISPIELRTQLSYMQSKVGYDVKMNLQFWLSKAQLFNWQTYIYDHLIRQVGADKVRLTDFAVAEYEWDGHELNVDRDMPPDSVYMLNMMSWRKIVQTALQAYIYHMNQLVVNEINADGKYLDKKQSTIFSEYNWDCDSAITNSIQSGFAFDFRHI